MNLRMGSQVFMDVTIPLLWGSRAILQDREGRLSIIDLGGDIARPEVVGDEPAPGAEFVPTAEGFEITREGRALYSYSPASRSLTGISLKLPSCQVGDSETRIGGISFSGNVVVGSRVGIVVSENGIGMGASLPPGLANLIV